MIYDLAIIGAGPAGYVAAERAAKKGLKTILFDKNKLGGVCLNEGCIPTKTLLYTAKLYESAKEGAKYGILVDNVGFDFAKIMKRKDKVVKKLVGGVGAKMKNHGVDVVYGEARIKEQKSGEIKIEANDDLHSCKNLLVATGSEAYVPPIPGLDREKIYTNKEILEIKDLPEELIVIGGGVVGTEFAGFFSSMGTKVTVIEMLPEILPGIDTGFSSMLREEMEKKGIVFHLGARVTKVSENMVTFVKNGTESKVTGAKILVSVGRKPVTGGIGLEKLGVELVNGAVKIDSRCRTNLPNVFAAGDVTGFSLLAHTASREGEVVVNNLSGRRDIMRYMAIPAVVYTNPEISSVGLTEQEAIKRKINHKVKSLPMAYAGRFVAENEGKNGLCKIITGEHDQLLGVHMIGNPSSEIIYGAAMAIEMQMRIRDIEEVVFPHPTVSEIFKETAFAF